MVGTIPLSLSQQLDEFGKPLAAGRLYLIQAGTVATPQNGYQDAALTLLFPNPIILDSAGRIPQFFLADGSIKIRLVNEDGLVQIEADNVLVIGASSGGGGGSSVDATTVLQTGQLVCWYATGVQTGFVRANGRTMGSATSGATERANADTQPLYIFLWNEDLNLSVSTGRGVSGAADFAANKTITLPDFRGRVPGGLDDMGNSAAGRLTATYFGAAATALGVPGGLESQTLLLTQLPTGITAAVPFGFDVPVVSGASVNNFAAALTPGTTNMPISSSSWSNISSAIATSNNTGGLPHRTVQPTMLITFYMKL